MKTKDRSGRAGLGPTLAVVAMCAALAATGALAAPFTMQLSYAAITGSGSASGSITFDDSLLATGTGGPICNTTQISSFTLTFTGLSTNPSTTTFTKADLTGWILTISGGAIFDLNFFMGGTACAANFNGDGYAITGVTGNVLRLLTPTGLEVGEYERREPSIPALSTYGIAALALLVLIAGALLAARRSW